MVDRSQRAIHVLTVLFLFQIGVGNRPVRPTVCPLTEMDIMQGAHRPTLHFK